MSLKFLFYNYKYIKNLVNISSSKKYFRVYGIKFPYVCKRSWLSYFLHSTFVTECNDKNNFLKFLCFFKNVI